jgi:prophage DNA circulation protein
MSIWQDLLLPASYNGVSFSVRQSRVVAGRKTAVHQYPFSDTIWVEDLGKKGRSYSFEGFIVGDDCYILEIAMLAAVEKKGPGILVHPSLGIKTVSVTEFSSSQDFERGRSVNLSFTFLEGTQQSLLSTLGISTGDASLDAAINTDVASAEDFASDVVTAFAIGETVVQGALTVANNFNDLVNTLIADPALPVHSVAGIVPPAGYTYGRYANGALGQVQTGVTTVAEAIATLTAAVTTVTTASATLSAAVVAAVPGPISTACQALAEAVRAAAIDPADQVRLLTDMAGYEPVTMASGTPIGAAVQAVQLATAAVCRRAALTSMERACAAYAPTSYNDAVTLRDNVITLFDAEILVAGDAGDVNSYQAMRASRTAIVLDLNTRGATLPSLIEVVTPTSLPAFALAYQLYADGSRADDVIARADPIHPAFLPISMILLSA